MTLPFRTDFLQAAAPKEKCNHGRAKADLRCWKCGKPTRSHQVEKFEADLIECPDCGQRVSVLHRAVECHTCFEAEKIPKES